MDRPGRPYLFPIVRKITDLVEDIEICLLVQFRWIWKSKISQEISGRDGHFVFSVGPKNTNLVCDYHPELYYSKKNGNRRFTFLVLGRKVPYFVNEQSYSKNKYTDVQDDIINMLEFLVDNIFMVFGGKVFQQIVSIPMAQIVPLSYVTYFCTHTKQNSYSLCSKLERKS